jgi:hyperosmotically inducible periplasmic protein
MSSTFSRWIGAIAISAFSIACAQTDAGVTTAVKTKLAANDEVKAYQIDVDTKDKVVTLSGNVDTKQAKTRAVELARATDGVTNVIDNITVRETTAAVPPPDAERVVYLDSAVTTSVKTKLLADPSVRGLKIDVDTRDGVVTLTGQVATQAEKDQALKLARETDGVKSVTDHRRAAIAELSAGSAQLPEPRTATAERLFVRSQGRKT